MYIPKHFEINDRDMIYEMIEKYSFAMLFSQHNGEPYATHLPLLLNKEEQALYGHFALPNGQWKDAGEQQVLAIFHGPHCYISPSWYETKKAVPTWNYVAVHVYGKLELLEDSQVIYNSLNDSVRKYERSDSGYTLDEVDPKLIEGMSKGIVAFKIHIIKIEAKAKLSQNHSIERKELVIEQLEKSSDRDDREIAALMRKNI
ncbi:FMN-binding negative transcriptional regulator [Bacillus sp. AGMB 02131]|uniref:FMN-binding negative transcriptional regulator n=1 Tax=Peribacillus faecalis TaxID=2772559 RepID=A0A927HAJ8_9BACI|nr:FMN-binding negative transcriptional regulator [Peribacillus faecalis]MBD3107526.1 FMN-binding negative transcriptional regulator [Peribacillus faecalis]